MKTKKVRVCAYCGPTKEKTNRDHVVPQAFWGDRPLPLRTITVPACPQCHDELDQDATYFRNIIVVGSDMGDHPALEELADGAVRRSVQRRDNHEDLTKNAIRGFFQTEASPLYQDLTRIDVDEERLLRTPKKIVRGLFYHLRKTPVPASHEVRIWPGSSFWETDWFKGIEPHLSPWQGMGDDIFQLRHLLNPAAPDSSYWLMLFFKSQAIFGATCPRQSTR